MASAQHLIRFRSRARSVRTSSRALPVGGDCSRRKGGLKHNRVLGVLALLGGLFGPARALAEPSDADRATARALATEGHDALVRQDYATAEDRFRRADALIHAPSLVVEHARALTGLGRRAAASRRYEGVLREGVAPSAPWAWKRALKDAELELAKLKPELAWLSIRVEPSDAEVLVDQELVPPAELAQTRAVDPGTTVVRATAAGYLEKEIRVELTRGATQEVALTLAPRLVPTESVVLDEPPARKPPPPSAPKPPDRTLAIVAFSVGAAGLATGITTGVIALGKKNDLESECRQVNCEKPALGSEPRLVELREDRSSYHLFGLVSGVGFGVGLAGAAAGLYLWVSGTSKPAAPATGRVVLPYVGVGSAGLTGSF